MSRLHSAAASIFARSRCGVAVVAALVLMAGCSSKSTTPASSASANATTPVASTAIATSSAQAAVSTSGSATSGESADPCSLVTGAQITAAFGVALVAQGARSAGATGMACTWGTDTRYLKIEVYQDAAAYKTASVANTTQLSGPWDKGSYFTAITGTSVAYLKGATTVAIQFFNVESGGPDLAHVTALVAATASHVG
jgi:hypothetical protein